MEYIIYTYKGFQLSIGLLKNAYALFSKDWILEHNIHKATFFMSQAKYMAFGFISIAVVAVNFATFKLIFFRLLRKKYHIQYCRLMLYDM